MPPTKYECDNFTYVTGLTLRLKDFEGYDWSKRLSVTVPEEHNAKMPLC